MTTYTLPAYWASALVNNDRTGLDHRERAALDQWLRDNDNPSISHCSDESRIGNFEGKLCDVLDFYAP